MATVIFLALGGLARADEPRIHHTPPRALQHGSDVIVKAEIESEGGVTDAYVMARSEEKRYSKFPLHGSTGGHQFTGVIPSSFVSQSAGLEYYIVAYDAKSIEEGRWRSPQKPVHVRLAEAKHATIHRISVHASPPGAIIELDGETAGMGSFEGPLPPGEHQLSVSLRGYEPFKLDVKMPADHDLELTPTLSVLADGPPPVRKATGPAQPRPTANSMVKFSSVPPGALVFSDGVQECPKTPCLVMLSSGPHELIIQKKGYIPDRRQLDVADGITVSAELVVSPTTLAVETTPAGILVEINGSAAGTSPVPPQTKAPGSYIVAVADPCFRPVQQTVTLEKSEPQTVRLTTEPRTADLSVKVLGADGKPAEGAVLVDGEARGHAPGQFKLALCSRTMTVLSPDGSSWSGPLKLDERQAVEVTAALSFHVDAGPGPSDAGPDSASQPDAGVPSFVDAGDRGVAEGQSPGTAPAAAAGDAGGPAKAVRASWSTGNLADGGSLHP